MLVVSGDVSTIIINGPVDGRWKGGECDRDGTGSESCDL
jgi:hypothetical protein